MSTAPKVFAAITAVTAALSDEGIAKGRTNTQGSGYKFRGIDDVLNALSRKLADNRLVMLPRVTAREVVERTAKSGGALYYVVLNVEYDLVSSEDGSKHTIAVVGEAMDSGDKATNKAMSAAYKYAAIQAFAIPTEGDNDADATTHEVASRERPARQIDSTSPKQSPARENVPVGDNGTQQAPAAAPKNEHPLLLNLRQLLAKYGDKAALFSQKTSEAMGVKTIEDIPSAQLPVAIKKVMEHQQAAKAAKAAASKPVEGAKPAAKKPTGKKAPLPPPDNTPAPDMQEPDGDDSDDGLPV